MDVLYTWKTIAPDCFDTKINYLYGNKTHDTIDDWNSTHEDLQVSIAIRSCKVDDDSYFFPEETFAIVFSWTGDSRFGGSSPFLDYRFDIPFETTQFIPKGTCGNKMEAQCSLVIKRAAFDGQDWYRPPGSIISSIPVIASIKIDRGAWFPIEEYEGDGTTLLRWDFANMDSLDLSVSSCVLVLVDTKHPMASLLRSNHDGQSLLTLLVVQGLCRKAFTEEVFDQLDSKQKTGGSWTSGSAGASFNSVLQNVLSRSGFTSYDALRVTALESPEKLDEIVDRTFSLGLMSSFKK